MFFLSLHLQSYCSKVLKAYLMLGLSIIQPECDDDVGTSIDSLTFNFLVTDLVIHCRFNYQSCFFIDAILHKVEDLCSNARSP